MEAIKRSSKHYKEIPVALFAELPCTYVILFGHAAEDKGRNFYKGRGRGRGRADQ